MRSLEEPRFEVGTFFCGYKRHDTEYFGGADDKNTPHNGGYAARYNATAGFQKIPENQISLSYGTLSQNAGFTDASSDYNGWK